MTTTRIRMSAEDRRAAIEHIALARFAETGLHGTSTETIAREAGISHAYLFRLYPTKKDLFLACAEHCVHRVLDTFRAAADSVPPGGDVLEAMGRAYVEMLSDRAVLRSQMQLWVACADDDIRRAAQRQYGAVFTEIERLSGADEETVRAFVAKGMLMNVSAALALAEIAADEPWVRRLLPEFG